MSLKGLIVIFLILALAPVFLDKVTLPQLSDFFKSWKSFKLSFEKLVKDDYNFYKSLALPWINKLIDFIKEEIKKVI